MRLGCVNHFFLKGTSPHFSPFSEREKGRKDSLKREHLFSTHFASETKHAAKVSEMIDSPDRDEISTIMGRKGKIHNNRLDPSGPKIGNILRTSLYAGTHICNHVLSTNSTD